MTISIHMILGPVCSGKSTYIRRNFSPEKDVIVRVGNFLRESIGLGAMRSDPSPNVCNVTETWVRLHVRGALATANALNRDIVFDGYPRSPAQVDFLKEVLESSLVLGDVKIVLHQISIGRDVLEDRIRNRSGRNPDEVQFDLLRLQSSIDGVENVCDRVMSVMSNVTVKVVKGIIDASAN